MAPYTVLISILSFLTISHASTKASCENGKCDRLGTAICMDPNYAKFVDENCCVKCAPYKADRTTQKSTTEISTSRAPVSQICYDKEPNCASFGLDVCVNPLYAEWVITHCAKHCKICEGGIKITTIQPMVPTTETSSQPNKISSVTQKTDATQVTNTPAPCNDTIPNCNYYSLDDCQNYHEWAKYKCPKYCNLCSNGICEDKANNCVTIGTDVCVTYRDWAIDHCAKFCNLCPGSILPPTSSPQNTVNVKSSTSPSPQVCADKRSDCQMYHKDVCKDRQYTQWARENCAKYCDMCGTGCYFNGTVIKEGESFVDQCKFRCTCNDGTRGLYTCTSLCYTWQLPAQCTLLPPKSGKCCERPSCPSNVHIKYPPGYTEV